MAKQIAACPSVALQNRGSILSRASNTYKFESKFLQSFWGRLYAKLLLRFPASFEQALGALGHLRSGRLLLKSYTQSQRLRSGGLERVGNCSSCGGEEEGTG
jgi:hypothetical protein